jgi:hypothetical protein
MTFSPLINRTVPHSNKYNLRQGVAIVRTIQHHHAAVDLAGLDALVNPSAQKSVHYIILSTGELIGQVPEEFRAWTSGSFEADANALTIEVQNSGGQVNGDDNDPSSWKISDAAYNTLINLVADIAKRHNFGAVSTNNYIGHRQVYATACPGGYLWSKMANTRSAANVILSKGVNTKPTPATPPVKGKTIWQLADETIAGLHGSGAARQKALGSNYAAVQAEVNRRLGVGPVAAKPKSIAQLADETIAGKYGSGDARIKALGSNYAAVQAEVNRRLNVNAGPSISQLADGVLRGQYGSGAARQRALGTKYAAVQAEVNRRMGV